MAVGYLHNGVPDYEQEDRRSETGAVFGGLSESRRTFLARVLTVAGLAGGAAATSAAIDAADKSPDRLRVTESSLGYTDLECANGRGRIRFIPLVHRDALGNPVQIDTSLIPDDSNIVVTEAGGDSPFGGMPWQFIQGEDLSPLIDWMRAGTNRMVALSDFTGTSGAARSMKKDMYALGAESLAGILAAKEAIAGTSSVRLTRNSPVHEIGSTRRGVMAALAAFFATGPLAKLGNFATHSLGIPGSEYLRAGYAKAQDVHPEIGRWTRERDTVIAAHAAYLLDQLRADPRSENPTITITAGADHAGIVEALQMPREELYDLVMQYRERATEYDKEHGFYHKTHDEDQHDPDSTFAIPIMKPGRNEGSVPSFVVPVEALLDRVHVSKHPLRRHIATELTRSQSIDLVTGQERNTQYFDKNLLAGVTEKLR